METNDTKPKIHPLAATAAVALILLSLTGIAAMTGILPNFSKPAATDPATTAPTNESIGAAASASLPEAQKTETAANEAKEPARERTTSRNNRNKSEPSYNAPNYNQVSQANNAPVQPAPVAPPPCYSCGVVESVRTLQEQQPSSGLGAAAGALLGGVLGHQVGGGNGKTLATVAGAVGGGLAGNAVEKNTHTATSYEVIVRMEDGSKQRFIMKEQRFRNGNLVRVDNGNLSIRDQ